jgi:hypothetical protein
MPGAPADIELLYAVLPHVPRHVLHRELEAMLDRPLPAPVVFAPAMDVTSRAGQAWAGVLRLIEQQSGYRQGLLDPARGRQR